MRCACTQPGRGVDFVCDSVGGPGFLDNFDQLAVMRKLLMFGFAAGQPDPDIYTPMGREFARNLGF